MSMDADGLVAAYLDGELDGGEARRLEERLHEPEVAVALSRELALRSWLENVGPHQPPQDLTRQLERAVTTRRADEREAPKAEAGRFGALRAALAGMSWMARGPAMAVAQHGVPIYGLRSATEGLGTVGYAMVPLNVGRAPRKKRAALKKRSLASLAWRLWRRK